MNLRSKVVAGVASIGAACFVGGVASPAMATNENESPIPTVQSLAPEVLENRGPSRFDVSSDGEVKGSTGNHNEVRRLHQAQSATDSNAQKTSDLAVSYNPESPVVESETTDGIVTTTYEGEVSIVGVSKNDGSAQMISVLEHESADHTQEYTLHASDDATVSMAESGGVAVTGSGGEFIGGLSAPWARDAQGDPVDTHYEVDGNVVRQVISPDEGDSYPIVADPYLGTDLLKRAWYSNESRGYSVNAIPTTWGRTFSGTPTHNAHVDELKDKLGGYSWAVTSTIDNQFICHVMGNYFEDGTYNMESWRPDEFWANQLNLSDQCNPGGGGSS